MRASVWLLAAWRTLVKVDHPMRTRDCPALLPYWDPMCSIIASDLPGGVVNIDQHRAWEVSKETVSSKHRKDWHRS